jgi:hypothetical protein
MLVQMTTLRQGPISFGACESYRDAWLGVAVARARGPVHRTPREERQPGGPLRVVSTSRM